MTDIHSTPIDNSPDSGIRTDRPSGNNTVVESNVEVPLSLKETPYTLEFFDINPMDDFIPLKEEVSTIEDYVMKMIADNSLENSVASYRSIMKELMNSIGINENEISSSKIAKISTYIKLLHRDIGINQQLQEMIKRKDEEDERVNKLKRMI